MPAIASLLFAAVLLALVVSVGPAHAQLARTFVSSLGNDASDCSRTTPCRTFQRAHDNTLALGEITVLDPGGYGAVTITRGISIINDGVGEAGVLVSNGLNGITINAPASDAVVLRGLTIKGIGFGGGNGIVFNSGKALSVENCTIRNLDGNVDQGSGIKFQPSTDAGLAVTNTTVTDNDRSGIVVAPTDTGAVRGVLNGVELYNNGNGVSMLGIGPVLMTVTDSVVSHNGLHGFYVPGGAATRVILQRSAVWANNTGLFAASGARIIVNESMVVNNRFGWVALNGGVIFSYQNNMVAGNGSDEGDQPLLNPR